MLWFDQDELAYYHPNTNGYCYCEELLSPSDLILQARIPKVDFDDLVLRLRVFTPDGTTVIAGGSVIEDYCKFIVATDVNGDYYINFQCQSFPPALCNAESCFILRFEVFVNKDGVSTSIFDKFTQQYCLADCCSYIGQAEAGTQGQGDYQQFSAAVNAADLISECGKPIVRIESRFPCIDNYTGDYYGPAIIKLGGYKNPTLDDIIFFKVTNIEGLFKRVPRDVKVTIAQNCKVQKTEGTAQWNLQSSIPLPLWKMIELENMFSANTLIVNAKQYDFSGGTAFERLPIYQKDNLAEFFRFNGLFQECRKWQIFGCGEVCVSRNGLKYIPIPTGQDVFKLFDSSGMLIANTFNELKTYLIAQPGTISVTDVSYPYISYGYDAVLQVESTGIIPSYFYINSVGANSKIYAVNEVLDLSRGCTPAAIGMITDSYDNCASAVIGTITDSAAGSNTGSVYSQNNWAVQGGSSAVASGGTVVLNFTSHNAALGNSQGSDVTLSGDVVGLVFAPFIPVAERTIVIPTVPSITVIITTSGEIRWFGPAQVYPSYAEVVAVNITYNI